ncbi:MAG: prolyl oligopeptidase family serine peptidase [Pseudomonadota bacterium]
MRTRISLLVAVVALAACQNKEAAKEATIEEPVAVTEVSQNTPQADDNLWLEEVEGERALDWVRAQNERSLADVQGHPVYEGNLEAAMELAVSDERIPYGRIIDGQVYNFWQDDTNVRGIWRRTSLSQYEQEKPEWETVLDFDQLARDEDKNWVNKGTDCFVPQAGPVRRCMVSLSDGGKDAVVNREFDLIDKVFVADGFSTPEAKQGLAWIDADTLLVATDWEQDGSTLTESGYPSSVRVLQRGQSLDEAQMLYTGDKTDVGVWPWSQTLDDGQVIYGAVEADTFFTATYWLLDGDTPRKMPIPPKATPGEIFEGYQLVTLQQDWVIPEQDASFQSGDLVAFELNSFLKSGVLPRVQLVFRANERQAVNGVAVSSAGALLSINDNVTGRLLTLTRTNAGWQTNDVELPGTGRAGIAFSDKKSPIVFINYEGFLSPDSLLRFDARTSELTTLKSLPAKFNTDGLVVEQKEVLSKDGTRVPYFLIRRDDVKFDGTTPTLLYGYGGFEISLLPSYSPGLGRMWLEKGGAYALANIRGGGEFGPAWHQAGLKGKRQVIYDDFIAIGEDLIESKLTSSKHLGIMGGSNGGLLMGVMMTQRPDLWNAVVVQVPLLDMLRYHKLLAGASWVDEYGDPEIPEERAFLEQISPYHNFDQETEYPTPFFVTSTKDDRVHPGHARKMARLFESAEKPFLYYENIDGGHSAAANQKERAKRTALEFTYLADRLFEEE